MPFFFFFKSKGHTATGDRVSRLNVSLFFPQVHNPSWLHHQSYIMPPTVSIWARSELELFPVSLRHPPFLSLSLSLSLIRERSWPQGWTTACPSTRPPWWGPWLSSSTTSPSAAVEPWVEHALRLRFGSSSTNLFFCCLPAAVHACKHVYAGDLHPPVHSSASHQHLSRGNALLRKPLTYNR